jgi:hypothetical protein
VQRCDICRIDNHIIQLFAFAQLLDELSESLEAAEHYSPIVQGPHAFLLQSERSLDWRHKLLQSGDLSRMLGGLNGFYEISCDVDLVEYRSGPNHDDAGNDLSIDNGLPGEAELSIVRLE